MHDNGRDVEASGSDAPTSARRLHYLIRAATDALEDVRDELGYCVVTGGAEQLRDVDVWALGNLHAMWREVEQLASRVVRERVSR